MSGASRPVSTMIPSTTSAARDVFQRSSQRTPSASGVSRGRAGLMIPESWVCPGIEQIGEQASQRHHDAADDDSTDDERIIARADGVDDGESHSRPGEDLLDEERAGEESRKRKSDQADDRKERVAQRVPSQDLAL